MILKNKKIIFFARYKDSFSQKIYSLLKKKYKFVRLVTCQKSSDKINFKELEKLKIDYIFSFRFLFKIPQKILNKSLIAINFHPGPHEYRGIGCVNFAIYNRAKVYGITAHMMDAKIDNGLILDVVRFPISKKSSIDSVLSKSYKLQTTQAKKIINKLYDNEKKFFNLKNNKIFEWSKKITFRKDLDKLYEIPLNANKAKIEKIIQSTLTSSYKPYVVLKGIKFFYEK